MAKTWGPGLENRRLILARAGPKLAVADPRGPRGRGPAIANRRVPALRRQTERACRIQGPQSQMQKLRQAIRAAIRHPQRIDRVDYAAIYQQVSDERFNGDFSAFASVALDAFAGQLGYPVKPH